MKEAMTPKILHLAVSTCLAASASSLPGVCAAQTEGDSAPGATADPISEVVVTGSHLRRATDAHISSPLETIGREQLETTPRATLGDFIVESTINSGSFSSGEKTSQSDATAVGFNLRGLGPGATLVLVNGHRQAVHPQPDKQNFLKVDVNSLMPSIMLDRIEILKDGAAAVYGSDAVAGVVNFITRDKFEGMTFSADWQKTEVDGKNDYDFQALWGQQGERGGVVTAIEYQKRDPSWLDELFPASRFKKYEASTASGMPSSYILNGGNGPTVPDPLCGDPRIDAAADALSPADIGRPVSFVSGNMCRRPFSVGRGFGSDEVRYTGMVRGHYDVTPAVSLHVEAAFNRTEVERGSVPTGVGYPLATLEDSLVPASNPGNPFGQDVVLTGARSDFNGSPWRAPGAKIGTNTTAEVVRLNTGFEWNLFDDKTLLNFDVTYSSVNENLVEGDSIRGRTGLALRGLGGPKCDPATGVPGQGNCMYFNPFANSLLAEPGDPRYNSPEIKDWITPASVYKNGSSELTTIDLGISSELLKLPAGPMSGAVGVQYRGAKWALEKDIMSNEGLFVGAGVNPDARGTTNANAAYVELGIPVVKQLELSLAGRYEDFGGGVNSFDPRIGIVFTPINDLTLRATYSTAFRTAGLNQLFATQVGGSTLVLADGSATTVSTNFVGNPDVAPETSTSVNFGIGYRHRGWRAELDFWDFRFKDIVGTVAPQDFFDQNPNSPLISYDPNGVPIEITLPITNLSSIKTNGVDLNLGYTADLGRWGILDLDSSTTYVHKYDIQTVPGGPVVDGVGKRQFASNFAAPMPRWRGNYRAMLTFGPERMYRASLSGHYVDSVSDPIRPTPAESFFPIDFRLSATLGNSLRFLGDAVSNAVVSFSVNNMLDEAPPPIKNDNITFEDKLYDGYGRQYVLGVNVTF